MNSCRYAVHAWPVAVRNLMASSHSSGVRSTSRANSCKCRTAAAMISLRRGFSVEDICSIAASVIVFSSIARMLILQALAQTALAQTMIRYMAEAENQMSKQPAAGIIATLIIVAISLAFISLFELSTFTGWVAY